MSRWSQIRSLLRPCFQKAYRRQAEVWPVRRIVHPLCAATRANQRESRAGAAFIQCRVLPPSQYSSIGFAVRSHGDTYREGSAGVGVSAGTSLDGSRLTSHSGPRVAAWGRTPRVGWVGDRHREGSGRAAGTLLATWSAGVASGATCRGPASRGRRTGSASVSGTTRRVCTCGILLAAPPVIVASLWRPRIVFRASAIDSRSCRQYCL